MIRYAKTDETGRIGATTEEEEYAVDMDKFEFPDDFDFLKQSEYRIIDGKLVHDPLPPTEEEIESELNNKRRSQMDIATTMFLRASAKTLSDEDALAVSTLFNEWKPDIKYEKDDIIQHEDNIYRIGQDHTSQAQWIPGEPGSESLYSLISIDEGGYEVWKEFDGISGIYKEGQIVMDPSNDKLYKSKIPNNVYGPPHEQPMYWDPYEE